MFEIFNLGEISTWLHEVRAPALVVAAELDATSSPEVARRIAASLPDAALVVLDKLKHSILLEAPERVASPVREFLKAHPLQRLR